MTSPHDISFATRVGVVQTPVPHLAATYYNYVACAHI